MERPEIDTIAYWEDYRSGLSSHLERRKKGKYFSREIGQRKKAIGEIELDFERNDEKLITDEIDRIDILLSYLRAIKKWKAWR